MNVIPVQNLACLELNQLCVTVVERLRSNMECFESKYLEKKIQLRGISLGGFIFKK